MNKHHLQSIADFVYESGILAKTPRSGLWFLGTGAQSVAEHSLRTAYIGYALCHLTPKANKQHVLFLSLFHDIGEGRTSDLNYVHQRYGRLSELHAIRDLAAAVPFGKEISAAYRETSAKKTLEAKLTKDADNLEWLATMREEEMKGNTKARSWAIIAYKRLKTPAGKAVGKVLLRVHPDHWWFDENDEWFVSRGKAQKKWKRRRS